MGLAVPREGLEVPLRQRQVAPVLRMDGQGLHQRAVGFEAAVAGLGQPAGLIDAAPEDREERPLFVRRPLRMALGQLRHHAYEAPPASSSLPANAWARARR